LPSFIPRRERHGELHETLRKTENDGSSFSRRKNKAEAYRRGVDLSEAQARQIAVRSKRLARSGISPGVAHESQLAVPDVEDVLTAASTMDQAVGCLLMDVMHFVSNAFNFEAHTLSVMNGGCAYPRQNGSADPVVIEDPLRRVNNVGRSCFRFGELQKILGDALIALSAGVVRSESHTHDLGTSIRRVLGLGETSGARHDSETYPGNTTPREKSRAAICGHVGEASGDDMEKRKTQTEERLKEAESYQEVGQLSE
jgi:hypothetical protein